MGGDAGNADNVKNLKIPIPTPEIELQMETLLKNKDYEAIVRLVYELYGRSEEEIGVIDSI
ncbi:MAG: hypothetical protein FWH18_01535 [Marinilabiliaceae bacterium]|nr:hypothetical protein [Marinilabiliaceae bacterium]